MDRKPVRSVSVMKGNGNDPPARANQGVVAVLMPAGEELAPSYPLVVPLEKKAVHQCHVRCISGNFQSSVTGGPVPGGFRVLAIDSRRFLTR